MNKTPIEWTDFTVNPIRFRNLKTGKVGHYCEKISPGCKNCYASQMQKGPYLSGLEYIATNKEKGEMYLDANALEQVIRRKKPARIFWCDMTDLLGEWIPDEWIDQCFAVMALTPQHTHQILTKRAERMSLYFAEDMMGRGARHRVYNRAWGLSAVHQRPCPVTWPLPNVWLGVSVEDQQRKDRIDWLRKTPTAVRFLSLEPLLEHLGALDLTGISWVIVGAESGPGARPCDIGWIRSIVAQCKAAGVACFVKQLGARAFDGHSLHKQIHGAACDGNLYLKLKDRKGGDMAEWPEDLRVREFPKERG